MMPRAATDSGVVVFPRLPVSAEPPTPDAKLGRSPRKKNPLNVRASNSAALPQARPTWHRLAIAAGAAWMLGLGLGFVVRPAVLPPQELADSKARVAALTTQQSQAQVEITALQSEQTKRATALLAVQAELKQALQNNASLTTAQTAQTQASAAQRTRVTELNKHLAGLLKKSGATVRDTPVGVIVRFSDNTWFKNSPSIRGGAASEIPAPPLLPIIDQIQAALAATPSPLQSVQIRSTVRSPVVFQPRRSRTPVVPAVDPWAQSALRAAMIGALLRDHRPIAPFTITAAGAGAVRGQTASSYIELELTLIE